jgi:hypothetical protein
MKVERAPTADQQLPRHPRVALTDDVLLWLVVLVGGLLLLAAVRLLGPQVGDLLFTGHRLHIFPAYAPQVMPKSAQLGRFAVAVLVTFLSVGIIVIAPRISHAGEFTRRATLAIVSVSQLGVLGIAVWAWHGQNKGINHLTPIQFSLDDLLAAVLIAAVMSFAAVRGWLAWTGPEPQRRRNAAWVVVALVVTALWLAPALYRALTLGHSLPAVWYPLQFTYDEFMSVLDGRTPLVNFDSQYASLLPFVTEPVFKLFGASVGVFTSIMWTLSLISFICLERSLAGIARNERTALLLYVPLLAISLFTLRHGGDERYFMANYYEVIPIRYVGPCVLFWCSVRHLRGLRPRSPTLLLLLAGLVAINNTEFGIPALAGCLLALASANLVPHNDRLGRIRGLAGQLVLGLLAAVVIVAVFTLLRAGSLPQLSRLTQYDQIYVITGFSMSPTPNAGLHIIIFMTFVATLVMAAVRIRSMQPDRVMTGALAFSGTFGIGAGTYYMGRSLPEVLAALFPAWGLATALLCLLALQALRDPTSRRRIWPVHAFPIAVALIILGLFTTAIDQFPAPWTQWQRLTADSHTVLFNTGPAIRFVRATTRPGEDVALLSPLGHIVSRDADVIDVSLYSQQEGIVTYNQLDDVIDALRASHGDKIFSSGILPEISQALTTSGFHTIAQDTDSGLTEWSGSSDLRSHQP